MSKIILDNSGNNEYNILQRDWVSTPVLARFLKIILASTSQLNEILNIKNKTFTGAEYSRKLVFGDYVSATSRSNIILLIPFKPPLILDGNTFFVLNIPANSIVTMAFYFDKKLE